MNNTSFSSPGQIEEISAPLLFITAGVAMVVAITTLIIKRIQNREDE
jgi:hypothetical protein